MTHPDTLTIPRAVVEQALAALLEGVAWREGGRQKASTAIDALRAALQAQAKDSTKGDQDGQQLRPEIHSVGGQQPVEGAGVSTGGGFSGSRANLVACITALLSLDAAGALIPHGIGGHARTLLEAAAKELQAQPTPPVGQAAETCPTCGASEPYSGSCGTSDSYTKALCKRKQQAAAQAQAAAGQRPLVPEHIALLCEAYDYAQFSSIEQLRYLPQTVFNALRTLLEETYQRTYVTPRSAPGVQEAVRLALEALNASFDALGGNLSFPSSKVCDAIAALEKVVKP